MGSHAKPSRGTVARPNPKNWSVVGHVTVSVGDAIGPARG